MKTGRVLVIVALALVLGGAGFLGYRSLSSEQESDAYGQVVAVQRGDIVAAISPTGEVYVPRWVELSFDVNKIPLVELNVAPGNEVRAGDVLARIDTSSLEGAVTQAEANLLIAQDDLEEALDPYTELDLAKARLIVAQAEVNLPTAQSDLEEALNPYSELDLPNARLSVLQAEAALEEAKESLEGVLNPDLAAAQAALRDAYVSLENARQNLVVTENEATSAEKLRTLEYEVAWYRQNYGEAQVKFQEGKIDQQKLDWEYSNMLAAEEQLRAARAKAENSLMNAKNQVTKAEEAWREARDNLAELQEGANSLQLAEAQAKVTQAEYDLAKSQDELAEMEAGPDPLVVAQGRAKVIQAEYDLAKAQDDLAKMEAGADPDDVEVVQARLVSAQAELEDARAALEAATMVAPFDGTVVDVGAEVGDLVSSNTVVVTLADLSHLEIEAMIDETEISQVEIGQEVQITFDALPGKRFSGKVLSVPIQGTLSQNVVTYDVPVSLEGAEDASLKPGMTANLKITVGQGENVLLVPAMAVQYGEGWPTLLVQDDPDGPPVMTDVEVGLSDGTYTEVVRGLNEGDQVMITFAPLDEEGGLFGFRELREVMPGQGMGGGSVPQRR